MTAQPTDPSQPRFPFVALEVPEGEDADEVSALLFELGADGVEERDATTLVKGAPGLTTLVAAFPSHDLAHEALAELDPRYHARLEEIVGDAWRDAWKAHFRPFALCEGVVVRPPWEPYEPKPGEEVLELEPGRAFGTGLHETTSLVAELLRAHLPEVAGRTVLDVGCGSGVLGLLALKLGAARVRGIDVDPEAVAVTKENAERNGLADRVDADTQNLEEARRSYPVAVANIEARVLIPMAETLMRRVLPTGLLILSGILVPQEDEVRAAYAPFELLAAPHKGEWVALALRAPAASG